ncbi:PAS domain-containing protein [Cellulosimicrobium marinum]|uniref:PAS domain-containing protein n=1 Tax=Cellulosimicrobium marinum TaxID=1638992 RepID=UPI001E5763AA|nr:PAS domain-containing protein [Cellulosimicrobium marinum]MCB7136107.1 PAS domain-containing protein [Cellulosimicrobium marinum]
MASSSVTTDSAAPTTPVRPASLAEVLAVGTHLLVGQYRVELASGTWWWSDEVYTMHGWEPGDVEPGLDALRSRKHPDDRSRVVRAATESLRSGRPFSCSHRIVDGHGRARSVVVTGQGRRDERGRVVEIAGYVVDVSPVHREVLDREANRAVSRAFVSAAAVEQAKGVLMAVHGVDDVAAAHLLAEAAGAAGVPVQETAAQVMKALTKAGGIGPTADATVAGAIAAVKPVARPHAHEAQLARRREPARR